MTSLSYSLPSFFSANARPSSSFISQKPPKALRFIQLRAFQDEERSTSNIVDENLGVLKERMEMVKVKERLERCCRCENGWNYYKSDLDEHDHLSNTKTLIFNLIQLIALVFGTVGSTCLSGTLLLCLVSLLVHLH